MTLNMFGAQNMSMAYFPAADNSRFLSIQAAKNRSLAPLASYAILPICLSTGRSSHSGEDGGRQIAHLLAAAPPRSDIDKQRRGENRNMFPAAKKSLPARLKKLPVHMRRELER